MAKKYGKCSNFGNCDYADSRKVIEILDDQEFICPEPSCGKRLNLVGSPVPGPSPILKILKIGVPIVVIIGLLFMFFDNTPPPPPCCVIDNLPFIALVDTTVVYNENSYKMQKCDTLKLEGDAVVIKKCNPQPTCPVKSGLLNDLRKSTIGMAVGMEEDSEPMYFFDENDRKVGFGYEFAKELAKKLGIEEIRTVEASYEFLPNFITQGKADIVVAGYIKDPEIPNILWSDSYLENGLCLIVKSGSAITKYTELSGKKIGLFKGDQPTKDWVQKNIPNVLIDDTHDETGWLENVQNGKWDAIIYDYIFAASEIQDFPSLRIVQFNIKPIEYSIMIPCNNDELLYQINDKIILIKNSDFYKDLYAKYFSTKENNVKVPQLTDCADCHVVQRGETLGQIALLRLGKQSRYMEIYELNKDRIASPHLIYSGTKLILPK